MADEKNLLSISVFVLLVASMVFVLKAENTQSFEMKNVKNQEPIKQKVAIKQEKPVKKEEKSIEKELPSADYYQYVRNSENKSMSRNVYDTVNY